MPADSDDALGIVLGIGGSSQNLFVARPLPLFHQSNLNPPHQGMKPEQRFYYHLNRGGQVVATSHVTQFVCDDHLELSSREMFGDALRQYGDMPPWFYLPMHPLARLSEAEKQALISGAHRSLGPQGRPEHPGH